MSNLVLDGSLAENGSPIENPRPASVHLRLAPNIHRQVRAIARSDGRAIADVLRDAVAQYVRTWNHKAMRLEPDAPAQP